MQPDEPNDLEQRARAALPRRDQLDEPRFHLQTAVMSALPHAATIGKMTNWRFAADEMVRLLSELGYAVINVDGAPSPDPDEVDGLPLVDLYSALAMLECPWRRRVGICSSGCREEPACETNEPEDGWVAEIRRLVAP